jgi:putative colanic acid biosynthesis acetyltransferase WcaF
VSTRPKDRLHLKQNDQASAYASPWSFRERLGVIVFKIVWTMACRWTPNPLNQWRLLVLRLFGCRLEGRPYVAATCRIRIPWQLELHHRACLGPDSEVYNLGECILRSRCTIAEGTYRCGGSHDFSVSTLPLIVGPIDIGEDAFIGARAFIMPGVTVGEGAVIGAAAVAVRDAKPWTVTVGNPGREIAMRKFDRTPSGTDSDD